MNFTDLTKKVRKVPNVRVLSVCTPKIGRNDKCPCGSGKKYKNCCGRAAS